MRVNVHKLLEELQVSGPDADSKHAHACCAGALDLLDTLDHTCDDANRSGSALMSKTWVDSALQFVVFGAPCIFRTLFMPHAHTHTHTRTCSYPLTC